MPTQQGEALISVELAGDEAYWYLPGGTLPASTPPDYEPALWRGHCDAWSGWLRTQDAAPLTNLLLISARAPNDGPTTVTDVDVDVYARTPMEGEALVACQYGAGGEVGTSIFPNLDAPRGPIPMDGDDDGVPETQLPGGRFFIASGETEYLSVLTKGQSGYVYELGLTVRADVNGQTQVEQFGSAEQPFRLAIYDHEAEGISQYDWDIPSGSWILSEDYLVRRAHEEESDRGDEPQLPPEPAITTPEAQYVDGVISPANPHGCDDTAINSENPCSFHWADEAMTAGPETPAQRWSACHQLGLDTFCD